MKLERNVRAGKYLPRALAATHIAFVLAAGWFSSASASESATFSYDALGRLVKMQVTSGVRSGVEQGYSYDAAGNRTQVQSVGPINAQPTVITPASASVNVMGTTGALRVSLGGTSTTGSVAFYVDGMFMGTAEVIDGQARIILQGAAYGPHTVRATYSGDANHDPSTTTFTVTVRDLSWLPAVIDTLLSN